MAERIYFSKEDNNPIGSINKRNAEIPNTIVFLTEDTQHITGGRYYSWWLATALKSAGYNVLVFTNRMPVFISNFARYPQPEIVLVRDIDKVDIKASAYFGSPIIGNLQAIKLGERYNRPVFAEIFDPFPMMEIYRGKHGWPGWKPLLEELKKPQVNIISLCKYANEYIYDWLNKTEDQVFEVYPCINDKARDVTPKKLKKENWVTFVSRLDYHKKLDHVLDAVKSTDCELHVITSIDGIGFDQLVKMRDMQDRVVVHLSSTDEEKFEIIKKSRATINGAIFEGFGMWLAESIACGVPCVCYDFPTFEEISNNANKKLVYFADWNDKESLGRKLREALEDNKSSNQSNAFNFEVMEKRVKEVVEKIKEPKIGVVQIALNEDKFIGASLRSVIRHKNISKVAVVEGAVKEFAHASNKIGLSVDKTKKEVLKVISEDKEGKIIYDRYGWASSKSELRNRALDLIGKGCNYIMVLDADEVWEQNELDKLVSLIKEREDLSVVWYPAYHFWKQKDLIAVGSQWDAYLFRFFKYEEKTLHWNRHETPVENSDGISVRKLGGEIYVQDIHFHHYGAMKDGKRIREKLEFYKKRDGAKLEVKDTWTNWKPGQDTQWTHGGGSVINFEGTHPPELDGII
jgi:glycosyltransferase involved in cell wall biosynthesis